MLITNFSSGEISPTLNGRVDLQQYYQAAGRLENFEIIPTGGIKRRVGSKRILHINDIQSNVDNGVRIVPFILDKDAVFIFIMEKLKITVYKLNADMTVTQVGTAITTEYSSYAELQEVQYAQNYDEIIFVHRQYKPLIVKYNFETHVFAGSSMTFDFYPDVELDDDYDFVMISNAAPIPQTTTEGNLEFTYTVTEGSTTQTYTKSYNIGVDKVYAIYDGKLHEYSKTLPSWIQSGTDPDVDTTLFSTTGKYPGCVTYFDNRLFFASTMNQQQAVWASATPETNRNRHNDFNTYKKYVTVNKVTKDADIHTFSCNFNLNDVDTQTGKTILRNVTQDFTDENSLQKSISNYFITGSGIPTGTKVLSCTADTITIDTAAMTLTENTNGLVMTIQLWRNPNNPSAEDYEYSVVNTNITTSDCSFYFELASNENDAIKFISSNSFLAIGTESTIWNMEAGSTALNLQVKMQGRYGSDSLMGMAVAKATIYFAQGRKGIREFYYDNASEAFQTNNIAILAEHLLRESAITDFDYLSNPYSKIIVTRNDGTVASMLYDKTNGVMGWNRITRTVGTVTNVAVTRGQNESDYIFFVIKDGNKRYLEVIDPTTEVFLDSWRTYTGEEQYSSGAILYNVTKDKSCSASDIPSDFIDLNDQVYIGYPIKSYIKSMPVVANDPTGKKRITNLIIRFLDSYMPLLKITGLADEKFTTITDLPYSGLANITYPGSSNRDVFFELETTDVYPVNILSVNANIA